MNIGVNFGGVNCGVNFGMNVGMSCGVKFGVNYVCLRVNFSIEQKQNEGGQIHSKFARRQTTNTPTFTL